MSLNGFISSEHVKIQREIDVQSENPVEYSDMDSDFSMKCLNISTKFNTGGTERNLNR
jgi:hypothetical protein